MNILILTEGGRGIGFGHLTRCIALYQAIEEKGDVRELIVNADESTISFVKDRNYQRFNWIKEQEKLMRLIEGADFVIIDSYLAQKSQYNKISEITNGNLLMIDDYKRIEYPRGIVVNSSIYGDKLNYPKKEGTTYLLGKDYIILRKEFWEVPEKKINKEIKNVLITFGGMRKEGLADRIVPSLKDRFDLDVHIVDSDDNRLSAKQMLEAMLKADICISGGGQTTYELARVGVPTIGICFAKNQRLSLETWQKRGFIEYAGWYNNKGLLENLTSEIEKLSLQETRLKMSNMGRESVDGQGSKRILSELLNLYANKN